MSRMILPASDRIAISQDPRLQRLNGRLGKVWLHQSCFLGERGYFCIPALFAARSMGYKFKSEAHVTEKLLKRRGVEGEDYTVAEWPQVVRVLDDWKTRLREVGMDTVEFSSDRTSVTLGIPGTEDTITLRQGGPGKKHYLLTEGFVRELCVKAKTKMGVAYAWFMVDIQTAIMMRVKDAIASGRVAVPATPV
mmetsp:Transcript_17095/g.43351  ORF Transcript_17095/g.43351 Transcript_17095/m.43351 type:complete len:193 (+) Transcript_17095:735-1313(+)